MLLVIFLADKTTSLISIYVFKTVCEYLILFRRICFSYSIHIILNKIQLAVCNCKTIFMRHVQYIEILYLLQSSEGVAIIIIKKI